MFNRPAHRSPAAAPDVVAAPAPVPPPAGLWPGPVAGSREDGTSIGVIPGETDRVVLRFPGHVHVHGGPRTGKSNLTRIVVGQAAALGTVQIYGIDILGGLELSRWVSVAEEVVTTIPAAARLLSRLAREASARATEIGTATAHRSPIPRRPTVLLVIDNADQLLSTRPGPSPRDGTRTWWLRDQMRHDLLAILLAGPHVGVDVVWSAQDPASLPDQHRATFPTVVTFRGAATFGLPSDVRATIAALPVPGRALVHHLDGTVAQVAVYEVTPAAADGVCRRFRDHQPAAAVDDLDPPADAAL